MAETPEKPGLTDNVAGLLAYVTIVPAILFLVLEPYNRNSFIRFHAWQSIFLFVAIIIVDTALTTVGRMGVFVLLPVLPLVGLAWLALWIMCMVKAYQNNKLNIPIISDIARQQAG